MLFAVILTPHPARELLFITKKRSGFLGVLNYYERYCCSSFDKEELARSV